MPLRNFLLSARDRLVQSRFFTISLTLHVIAIAILGSIVLIKVAPPEPPEMTSAGPLVQPHEAPAKPVDPPLRQDLPGDPTTIQQQGGLAGLSAVDLVKVQRIDPLRFSAPPAGASEVGLDRPAAPAAPAAPGGIAPAQARMIRDFADWRVGSPSSSQPKFAFTAFLGRYQGGNWNSTVRLTNGEITAGSLPNLLYAMSKWSNGRIQTNEREVKAISLDSAELLTVRPPFILLTGTRDFHLTDKEVENLRSYICHGGAVWGDSSVPGRRSAFDVAFRREMARVLPDKDKAFEPLPANHEIFSHGYYPKIRDVVAGINNYREPVEVMRYLGEVAIIHTINDYGDMWQIGLDKNGAIDLSRNARGEYVAMNPILWSERGVYVRNIDQAEVEEAYRFGINIVMHLLTRWENRFASSSL